MVWFRVVCGCMRVCDTSLEPSWTPYERKAPALATTLRTRPQCSKMCFLLHKLACNGRFETQTLKKSYIWYQNNDLANMGIDLSRAARPQCVKNRKNVILLHTAHHHHTIYKNHFVRGFWAVCGCVRVCDTSLEPSRQMKLICEKKSRFARAARPPCVKMHPITT